MSPDIIVRVNRKINNILKQEKLDREQNAFFNYASQVREISLDNAIQIAFNWRSMTRQFLYTTIRGLHPLVDMVLGVNGEANDDFLKVLKTSFYVISDDLNSMHPIFKPVAPKGVGTIHYKWWEYSILNKLTALSNFTPTLHEGVQQLLNRMHEVSNSRFGTPVQLRIVEAIALDISLAFFSIFSKVKYDNKLIFKDEDLSWITSHIEAETIHNKQVCDETSGMAKIVSSTQDEEAMLDLIQIYAKSWAKALDTLAIFLPH
jgi:hypothetical protein